MLEDLPMTKEAAIQAMRDGQRVTHYLFDPDEWVQETGRLYEFEDGCLCSRSEFWRFRTDSVWLENWKVWK